MQRTALRAYLIIKDGSITLKAGGKPFTKGFSFPAGTDHTQSMILQWVFVFKSNANKLQYRWSIIPEDKQAIALQRFRELTRLCLPKLTHLFGVPRALGACHGLLARAKHGTLPSVRPARPAYGGDDGVKVENFTISPEKAGKNKQECSLAQFWRAQMGHFSRAAKIAIRSSEATGNVFGSYHEVFKNVTFAETYTLKAETIGGSGSVDLMDVVVWFQNGA